MTNIDQTVKAVRKNFLMGTTELDGYQMPNGDYKMSRNGLLTLDIQIGNSTGKKYAQPILEADPSSLNLTKIEGQSASAKLMSLETFSAIVLEYAKIGNSVTSRCTSTVNISQSLDAFKVLG